MLKTNGLRFLPFLSLALCLIEASAFCQEPAHFQGITPLGTSAPSQRITVTLSQGGTVDQVKVLTQGSEDFDFQNVGDTCKSISYPAGQSCIVNIVFSPKAAGERRGTIILFDSNKHPLASQPLAATASGPVSTFVPGLITTVAGNSSTFFYAGDGVPAGNAALFLPFGVTLDGAGNIYIADTYNNRIRKVDAKTALISTVAGNGNVGFSGDGGSALAASLNNPSSVQLDPSGNIYIADTQNDRIRVVNVSTGVISTVAGSGVAAYSGDGGPASLASLSYPNGIAFDASGNLYIADTGNNVVRLVNGVTGLISTVAGTGTALDTGDDGPALAATLNKPWGVTITTSGDLYIADKGNNAIRKVNLSGTIATSAGGGGAAFGGDGGVASASQLSSPSATVIDVAGNIYISDTGNNRIRKINPSTNIITTIAGGGTDGDNHPATLADLYGPYAMVLDGQGSLFLADAAHNRIRKVSSNIAVLAYPVMRVGSVSAPLDQIIENDGVATLNVSAVTPVSYAQVDATTTCSSTVPLAPLAQCTVAADFAPTVTGAPVTGSISIASDAINAPETLLVKGTVLSTYPATVLLSSFPNPSIVGDGVAFSVQVFNAGSVVATGRVTLLDGTMTIATLTLINGVASTAISNLTVGQHTITASYAGDTNDGAAVSSPLVQVVNPIPLNSGTTTSLTSSANPVTVGQTLNLNASVAATAAGQAIPTGNVTFMEGTSSLGTGTLNAGAASIAISNLTARTHNIIAVYSGSGSYSSSTSPVLQQVIIAPNSGTTTSLTSSADPIVFGLPLILNSAVTAVATGQSLPTGTVNFMDGTTLLGTGTLASGAASFTTSTLSVGTHLITAVYKGSATYATSTSPVLTEIVIAAGTGNSVQFTLKVTPSNLSIESGANATLQIGITTSANFTDTLSLGCGGLPPESTCTFSQSQIAVADTANQSLSVVVDTGNPLGAGPTAQLKESGLPGTSAFLAILPGGALLAFLIGRKRRRYLGLLTLVATLCPLTVLTGCVSSYNVKSTPAGTYTFQIFANGSSSGASYTVPVQLTVTK